MKKLLIILLSVLMLLSLTGCKAKEDEEKPIVEEPTIEEVTTKPDIEEEPIVVGGFVDVEDGTITDELKDMFDKALEGLMGANYTPIELVSTQVVAGTNYKFLAEGVKTTYPKTTGTYYITISKDLSGNISLLDIEVIEESQEQQSTIDYTKLDYWVVFYDQYGNELQREALRYGSTPSFKGELPSGFVKWVLKDSGEDADLSSPVKGNKYFIAVQNTTIKEKDKTPKELTEKETPLYFTSRKDGTNIALLYVDGNKPEVMPVIQYSKDLITWTDYQIGELRSMNRITINKDEKLYFRAKDVNNTFSTYVSGSPSKTNCIYFFSDGAKTAETGPFVNGNIMSLLNKDFKNLNTVPDYCFTNLFGSYCSVITSAPLLPATNLGANCYDNMFRDCKFLKETPVLPATTLAKGCYTAMFKGCTALEEAPVLPATTLVDRCYSAMFSGCTALKEAPVLPATTLADGCYSNMFNDCTSLKEAPLLPVTTMVDDCYYGMFANCTSLEEAPLLPAMTLAEHCYSYMLNGCTSLKKAPVLPATNLAKGCYTAMFKGCTALEEAPDLPAKAIYMGSYHNMFDGCTSLTKGPKISATSISGTTKNFAMAEMFKDCSSLSSIEVEFTSWNALSGYETLTDWVSGVSSTGTFIYPKELTTAFGKNRIPEGWNLVHPDGSKTQFTIKFNVMGHGLSVADKTVYSGCTVGSLQVLLDDDNLHFDCWCYDEACKNPVDYTAIVTDDMILYAKWIPICVKEEVFYIARVQGNDIAYYQLKYDKDNNEYVQNSPMPTEDSVSNFKALYDNDDFDLEMALGKYIHIKNRVAEICSDYHKVVKKK